VLLGVALGALSVAARNRHDLVSRLRPNGADHVLGGDGAGPDQAPPDLRIACHGVSFAAKVIGTVE
jgi:hypothetical protein